MMITLEQIETAILQLPPNELRQLQEWLMELAERRWDEQLEQDVAEGRLEELAAEAIADFEAGRYRQL